MNCKNCNKPLPDDAKFCANCGTSLPIPNTSSKTVKDNTNQKKKWWQYKSMGTRELGATALILIFLGIYGFFNNTDSSSLFIFGFLLVLAWAFAKRRTAIKNKKRSILFTLIIALIISISILLFALITLDSAREKGNAARNVAMCPGETPDTQNDEWFVYYSLTPHFCAKFPSDPVHDSGSQNMQNGEVSFDIYKSVDKTGSVVYVINVINIPPKTDISDSASFLKKTIDFSANNVPEKVIASNFINHQGYPALDYSAEGDGNSMIMGLNVLVGRQVYQMMAVYDKSDEDKLEFEKFTDSLQIH